MTLRRFPLALLPLAVAMLSAVSAQAATPVPFTVPPPELAPLVPLTTTPFDKPPVTLVEVTAPGIAIELPTVPPGSVTVPATPRPVAPLSADIAACDGAASRTVSDVLECGKARLRKGDYDDAARTFQEVIKNAKDRDALVQARYWLAETLSRLGKTADADAAFRQAAGDRVALEYEIWSAHAAGWMALRAGDAARAHELFRKVLAGTVPPAIDAWARHGLGLSHYAAGKYADAARAWGELATRTIPADIAGDVALWYGDTLGRLGQYPRAEQQMKTFVGGARAGSIREHPLLGMALVRLGWWALAAGHASESVKAFNTCFASACNRAPKEEQDSAAAGLALALHASGDSNYARGAARWLNERKSPLAVPVAIRLLRDAVAAKNTADILAVAQEVLAGPITRSVRAWVLVMKGEALRRSGDRDEARTQYDLAQQTEPGSEVGAYATYRLAQADFELREFAPAAAGLENLVKANVAPELRAATLLLQGEAAYRAGNYATAAAAFRRLLAEFPRDPQAVTVQLSLPWIAYRQGQTDEARAQFLAFAKARPDDPGTADALMMAARITMASGDPKAARPQLDSLIARYPTRPHADFARLDRAILMVRAGQHGEAEPVLRDWIARAPSKPALGHAHAALGAALLAANRAAEAGKEFAAARREGLGAYASLGVGVVAMIEERPDDAARALAEARKDGAADLASLAEYTLAAVALERGRVTEFKPTALAALKRAPSGPAAPRFLYVLTGIAVEEKDLGGALDTAKKLVQQFPGDEAADDALDRVGAAAAKVPAWPIVFEAYSLLRQRYPTSPFVAASTRLLAEAAFQTGRTTDARRDLEQVVAAAPSDGRAWIMLAQTRSTSGDRTGALEAYERAAKETRVSEWSHALVLDHARLLVLEKRWAPARALFERLLKSEDPVLVLESAYLLGDTYRGEDNLAAAAQYYMTAAYLAPESPVGRRSLLAAGQAFSALKQPEAAAAVYRKLLAQTNVPGDLAAAAREGLQAVKGPER